MSKGKEIATGLFWVFMLTTFFMIVFDVITTIWRGML